MKIILIRLFNTLAAVTLGLSALTALRDITVMVPFYPLALIQYQDPSLSTVRLTTILWNAFLIAAITCALRRLFPRNSCLYLPAAFACLIYFYFEFLMRLPANESPLYYWHEAWFAVGVFAPFAGAWFADQAITNQGSGSATPPAS